MLFKNPKSLIARRFVVFSGLALMSASACSTTASTRVPKVLFICQYGSVKSAVARELFRRAAAERHIAVLVYSRGITPEEHLSPALKSLLARDHIDPAQDPLRRLERVDLSWADFTILFDPLPDGMQANRVHDWTDTGSLNQSYVTEHPQLEMRIKALLDEIAAK